MAEPFNLKRVMFSSGKQKIFLCNAQREMNLSSVKLACLLGVSNRTLTDWRREKFSMSLKAFEIITKETEGKFFKGVKIKNAYWYAKKGAKMGGAVVYKKYGQIGGDQKYRKKRWREWWEREGRHKPSPLLNLSKSVNKPDFSKELAEFAGIMLGDGGISKYQIYITLHSKDEKEYSEFVGRLIKKLFNVPVVIFSRRDDSTIRLVVSRIKLVEFCTKKLGLKVGNKIKQQVDVPGWVKKNKLYSIACVRGLFDTDGTIFSHKYKVGGKDYNYKKISFTSYSKPLLHSTLEMLNKAGIVARITKNEKDILIDSQENVRKYFKIFVPHNPKYLKKYQN